MIGAASSCQPESPTGYNPQPSTVSRMNCDEVRLELALWVGNDLDDPARIEELRRHTSTCPGCRLRAKSLQSSMVLLGATDPNPTYDRPESLWPELNARIDSLEKHPKSPPPYGKWALALVCGAAVSVGVWSWLNRPAPFSQPPVDSPAQPTPPVTAPSPGDTSSSHSTSGTP